MLRKIKQRFKGPLEQKAYNFLMREASSHIGRKPFDVEELKLLTEALLSQNLFGVDGKMVPAFEKEFARVYGTPYAVASTSGTAAIHTALGVLDLNPGDEIITAPITDLGTIIPILSLLGVPVFADIDHTYNMDPKDIEAKITSRTKAILAVHLFGNPCNMEVIAAIARKYNIALIEDCSQAHLTEYKGKFVGTFGDIGCFSFQQSKHMTTGDGGMTITSNKFYYEKMKLFVDKGFMRKGWGARAYGFHAPNYRMNELTAAVGLAQLKKVSRVVRKRAEMGALFTELLSGIEGVITAPVTEGGKSSFWQYPLYIKDLDIEALAKEMIKAKFWCSAGYTGKPIYLCSESLTAKKTFGNSQLPFNPPYASRTHEYKEGLCPKAEETLKHLLVMPWDEDWGVEKVKKAAAAFKEALQKISGKTVVTVKTETPLASATVPREDKKGTLKIGIIGCGQMGLWHFDAYRHNPLIQMVAFCDSNTERATDLAKRVGGVVYSDYREMFAKEQLNAVSICTVPSTHKDMTIAALQAGCHVLCEKPLALSTKEAEEMLKVAQDKQRLLLSAFKFRFFEEVKQAKEIIDQGMLGKIINFRLMFGGYINMNGSWFAQKEISGGGVIIDNGPHAFDLIHHLLGSIKTVKAHTSKLQEIPVEDTAHIFCELSNGGKGTIDISWSLPVSTQTYLEIYGEEGTLFLDFKGLSYKLKTWDEWRRVDNILDSKATFEKQISHFVDAMAGQKNLVTTPEDGLKAQQLIELSYKSL